MSRRVREVSKEEMREVQETTFATLEKGSFFSEQVGLSHPTLNRAFLCVDEPKKDEKSIRVVEISSVAFQEWLSKQNPPTSTYTFDANGKCINKLHFVDLGDPRAVEACIPLFDRIKKRQTE